MKTRWMVSAVLAAALMLTATATSRGQDVPRMPDGKPDFSGIYTAPSTVNATGPARQPDFQRRQDGPGQARRRKPALPAANRRCTRHDEPRAVCLPSGFPSGMLYILPIQIVQNPKHIVIIPELQRAARIIPLDGRPHREGIEPSYYGDSVGKWEGDTLVIDTVNFKRWILDDYHYTDPTKTRWHSDALRTTEHLRREGNKLLYRITIDDSEDLHPAFLAGLRADASPGLGASSACWNTCARKTTDAREVTAASSAARGSDAPIDFSTVPSAVRCSSDISPASRAWFTTASNNVPATSACSRRSRFWLNVVGDQIGSSRLGR